VHSTSSGESPDPAQWVVDGTGYTPDLGMPLLPRVGEAAGFTLARLAVLVVAAVGVDRVLGLSLDRAWAVLGVVMAAALTPAARIPSALAGAGVTWLLGTGFVSNRLGELSFDNSDIGRLLVVTIAAVAALAISRRAATVTRMRERGE
jgi:hypothetical protein